MPGSETGFYLLVIVEWVARVIELFIPQFGITFPAWHDLFHTAAQYSAVE